MRATHTVLAIAAAIVMGTPPIFAQVPQASQAATGLVPNSAADSTYLTRLAVVQAGDTTADLSALRRQFALTTFYAPYSTSDGDRRKRMWTHLNENDVSGADGRSCDVLEVAPRTGGEKF
jgi:hypothetical protein